MRDAFALYVEPDVDLSLLSLLDVVLDLAAVVPGVVVGHLPDLEHRLSLRVGTCDLVAVVCQLK